MLFQPNAREMRIRTCPTIQLCGEPLSYVDSVKYLGVIISNNLSDERDISRQIRSLYVTGYSILKKFTLCSRPIKNLLFRTFCYSLYCSQLWQNFTKSTMSRLRAAYNNAYRIMHNIPRFVSVRQYQVEDCVFTFDALYRRLLWSFTNRCLSSSNSLLQCLWNSEVLFRTGFHKDNFLTLH